MAKWIQIGAGGPKYEIVRLGRLTTMQMAKACREVGLTPERLEMCLDPDSAEVANVETWERMMAINVVVYAARVAAGERFVSVESANDFPAEDLRFVDDDAEEEEDVPPSAGEDAGSGPPES